MASAAMSRRSRPSRRLDPPPEAARSEDPGRQRRRPDEDAASVRAPAWPQRHRLRRPLHEGQARHLRLSRVSLADSPPDLSSEQPPQSPCTWYKEEGTITRRSTCGVERSRPLPSGQSHRRCLSLARRRRTCSRSCATSCRSTVSTSAGTARTCRGARLEVGSPRLIHSTNDFRRHDRTACGVERRGVLRPCLFHRNARVRPRYLPNEQRSCGVHRR